MSTERDDTTPIPARPGGTPGDQPTTPIPRPAAGRAEEPTLVFDTFAPEPDPRAPRPPEDGAPDPRGPGAGAPATPARPAAEPRVADDPAGAPAPGPVISRQLRVGTVVWGLVLAILGAGIIAIAAGATFDLELALIGLLALAGLGLVVGSLVTASRRRT